MALIEMTLFYIRARASAEGKTRVALRSRFPSRDSREYLKSRGCTRQWEKLSVIHRGENPNFRLKTSGVFHWEKKRTTLHKRDLFLELRPSTDGRIPVAFGTMTRPRSWPLCPSLSHSTPCVIREFEHPEIWDAFSCLSHWRVYVTTFQRSRCFCKSGSH